MSATFTPGVATNADGSVTTTNADGSTTTVAPDGAVLSTTPAPESAPVEPTSVAVTPAAEPTIADVLAAFNELKTEYETFKANPAVAAIARVVDDGGPDRMSGFNHIEDQVRDWARDEFSKLSAAA